MEVLQVAGNNHSVRQAVNAYFDSNDDTDFDRYELLRVISEGSYGRVYEALDKKTQEVVAMKHEFLGFCNSTMREIDILKSLPPHPSVVEFKGVFVDRNNRVFVVMEHVHKDLKTYIEDNYRITCVWQVQFLMKRILEGVLFLHENGLMHRDLKPSNILIKERLQVKICDFGLSRRRSREGLYTSEGVGSRWYKAPELLIGSGNYSSAVDMWSVGCIMAELIIKDALFKGVSEIDQLGKINELLHTPGRPASYELGIRFDVAYIFMGAPKITECGIDLVLKMLAYDPNDRITAKDALNHPWFKQ
ncbi:hypothetical protein ACP275_09G075200 [Erythranthe tilingii]